VGVLLVLHGDRHTPTRSCDIRLVRTAVVEVLVAKCDRALRQTGAGHPRAGSL
jgi:hypothetical protein